MTILGPQGIIPTGETGSVGQHDPHRQQVDMTREQQLETALQTLLDYTVDILTGPIMNKLVTWPEGNPRLTAPLLIKAQNALDMPATRDRFIEECNDLKNRLIVAAAVVDEILTRDERDMTAMGMSLDELRTLREGALKL